MEPSQIITQETLNTTRKFLEVPLENQELLPTLLPLIAGAIMMELYFGKHKEESLGWNTSVGNAAIWMTTGISILLTETGLSQPELNVTYALIGLGGFVAFMDFFHIWPASVAFIVSSSAIVYTLAYILVIIAKTSIELNQETLIAAGIFFIGINIVFKIIQGFETDQDSGLDV